MIAEIYKECTGCKHNGGQLAYGSSCEWCKRNPNFEDEYEADKTEEVKEKTK